MEHTPGPWAAVEGPTAGSYTVQGNRDEYDPIDYWSEANARLIAAAPELLEALVSASGFIQHLIHLLPTDEEALLSHIPTYDWGEVLEAKIEAVIAKAVPS